VFAFWQGRRLGMTRSDGEGRYRLANLRPGPVELFARSEDYALTVRTTGSAAAGELTVQDLVLVEGPRIEGVLRDPAGEPLAGLRVNAREKGGDVNRRSERTGEDGRFVVKNLYPGRYELRVGGDRRWGASRITLEVEVVAGLLEQDITVPYGSGISGVVRDDKGKPVAKANVFAIVGRDYRGATRTNEKGEFRFEEQLPQGTYQLFVRVGDDRMVGLKEVVLSQGASLDDVELIARRPARMRGRVLDPQGQGLAGVVIEVHGGSSPVQRRATTSDDGSFEIGPLYDGDYELEAAEGPLLLLARKWAVERVQVEGFRFRIDAGRDLRRDLRVEVTN
jgi:protocatechuate 3,4-dioxygenase beta subunit